LQQDLRDAAFDDAFAVEQNTALGERFFLFAVSGDALRQPIVVRSRGRGHERQSPLRERVDAPVDVAAAAGDVLDTLAFVVTQVFLDLALRVRRLVDGNTNLSARTRHRTRIQSGELAFDVEIADLSEAEKLFVEARPRVHPPAMHVMRQMIDVVEPGASGLRVALAGPIEFSVVRTRTVTISIDEVQEGTADPTDRRRVERRAGFARVDGLGAGGDRTIESVLRIDDAPGHRRGAWTVLERELDRLRAGLGVRKKIDLSLTPERNRLVFVPRDSNEPHRLEERLERS